jgi:superfamily II DNA/RNA helicase
VPTREIAIQVSRVISALGDFRGITVHTCIGGRSVREDMMKCATSQVIVGTCGRILDMQKRGAINLSAIKMLVIDELDEFMSNSGSKEQLYELIINLPSQGNNINCTSNI